MSEDKELGLKGIRKMLERYGVEALKDVKFFRMF